MKHGAAGSCREQALSEVIGFVLIIGIIMAAFSLYMVYGVPVQGRENEINHMSTINDQFVSYKIGIDSLVTNQQKGLAMSTSFPLGTAIHSAVLPCRKNPPDEAIRKRLGRCSGLSRSMADSASSACTIASIACIPSSIESVSCLLYTSPSPRDTR